jgi:hypothetical protein
MTTRREYAISLNLATPGKGRMSNAARDAIAKAEAEGMVFSDAKPVTMKERMAARPAPTPRTTVQRPVQERSELLSKPFTGKFEVQIPGGKRKALSERTACTCGASLSYCHCTTPTVYRTIVDPGSDDVDAILNIERV